MSTFDVKTAAQKAASAKARSDAMRNILNQKYGGTQPNTTKATTTNSTTISTPTQASGSITNGTSKPLTEESQLKLDQLEKQLDTKGVSEAEKGRFRDVFFKAEADARRDERKRFE